MQISDNILREQLKNVYFLGGGGYGGKTTMSQLIAKKYGFRLYHQDDCYDAHAKIAAPEFQPSMCLDRTRIGMAFLPSLRPNRPNGFGVPPWRMSSSRSWI